MAAVYPTKLCSAIIADVTHALRAKNHTLAQHSQAFWTCPKCKHGGHTELPHARVPGQCRRPSAIDPDAPAADVAPKAPARITTRLSGITAAPKAAKAATAAAAPTAPKAKPKPAPPALPATLPNGPLVFSAPDGGEDVVIDPRASGSGALPSAETLRGNVPAAPAYVPPAAPVAPPTLPSPSSAGPAVLGPPVIGPGADADIAVIPDAIIKPNYDFKDIQQKLRDSPSDIETCKLLFGLRNRFGTLQW